MPIFAGDVCAQPPATGIGRAHLLRWYFDPVRDQCRNFDYTGRGGNENNFLSKTECEMYLISVCQFQYLIFSGTFRDILLTNKMKKVMKLAY
ncbi:unnamed protein product [Gongylonema pulchrum]|uniref:BPTI/Kunitz inhibitor domain-containing protein n=1 Tax=Gongylonema pulchrum TaxID=637853 RepID=A0A3P6RJW4_9BILA|nr:unnamed protein product [Gongylonema pulchrum]